MNRVNNLILESLEKENLELKQMVIELKKENLLLQKDKPNIKFFENEEEKESSYVFKTQNNIKEDDLYFLDVLFQFYDETIILLDEAREGFGNGRNIFDEMINIYKSFNNYFSYFISDYRLKYIDEQIEKIKTNNSDYHDKIEEYYNKIYYEIIIEFLPLHHSFTPTN